LDGVEAVPPRSYRKTYAYSGTALISGPYD
jgi:hypothetical protein